MEKWRGKIAVVTGSSSGIGAVISEKLVKAGVIVVGLARRKEKLDELMTRLKNEPGKFYSIKADVTKEEDILKAFDWVEKNLGTVHILVNNAGVGKNTDLVEGSTEMWKEIFDTNVLALCIATREAVTSMKKGKVDGHIIHMNSILGHRVTYVPEVNVYSASKFAVTALTETLRQELNSIGSKIKITSISPGMVDTKIREASGLDSMNCPKIKCEDVADAVLYVLGTPSHVQVHELIIKPVGEMF
ncbi:hypothetical protein RI129_013154 [Pyrocoelia pectoralis]|uniref:Farnesol dehydrogenase n=1 Tax=Pyrocoelia pectoralis TaxID=417401 RepID=A0AAN7V2G0_9COLE